MLKTDREMLQDLADEKKVYVEDVGAGPAGESMVLIAAGNFSAILSVPQAFLVVYRFGNPAARHSE